MNKRELDIISDRESHSGIASTATVAGPAPWRRIIMDKLKETGCESILNSLIDNIPEPVFTVDADLKIIFANEAFKQNFFRFTGTHIGQNDDFFAQESTDCFATEWKKCLRRAINGEQFQIETSFEINGKTYHREASFSPVKKGEEIIGATCFSKDATSCKITSNRLNESEARFRSMIENSNDGIALLSADGKLKYVTPSITRLTGYSCEELIGMDPVTLRHPDDQDAVAALLQNFSDQFGQTIQAVYRMKNSAGEWRWINSNVTNLLHEPAIQAFVFNFEDITEQKKAEEEIKKIHELIREASERQACIINSLGDHIALLDGNGVIIEVNEAWKRFARENHLAYDRYGIGHNYLTISKNAKGKEAAEGKAMAAGIEAVLEGKRQAFTMKYSCDSPTERRWFKAVVTPLTKNRSGVVVAHFDITRRKAAELQIEFDRKNRDALINSTNDLMWSIDKDKRLITANHAFIKMIKSMTGVELKPGDDMLAVENFEKFDLDNWKRRYEKVLEGTTFEEQAHMEAPVERWLEMSFYPIVENGNVIGAACYLRDATERILAEQRIKKSEKIMADAENIAHFGSWELDLTNLDEPQQNPLHWSDEVFRIFGYEPGACEVSNDNFFKAVHPDDRDKVKKAVKKAIEKNAAYSLDHRIIRPDGTIRWVHENAKINLNEKNNRPLKMIGTVLDITERKEAEEKLRLAELNYREIFEKASDAIFIHDPATGEVLDVNLKVCELTGFSKAEILYGNFENLMAGTPGFTPKDAWKHMEKAIASGQHLFEWLARRKDGTLFWTEVNLVRATIAGAARILAFFRVIEDRKQAEEKLLKSEERYRQIVETAQEGIWMIDENNRTVYVNQKICEILEYAPEEMMGKRNYDFLDEEGKKIAITSIERRKQGIKENFDLKYTTKTGRQVWTNVSASPIFDKDGMYRGSLAMVTDISNRKRAEESLRLSNERYELVTKATNDAIWDWNLITDEVYWSRGYEILFGYRLEEDEISSENWLKRIHPEDKDRVIQSINNEIITPRSLSWQCEYRYIKSDNSIAYVFDRGYIIYGEEQKPVRMVGAMQDITARKLTEEALRKKTHDINERVKELNCLYNVSVILNDSEKSNDAILQACVNIIPSGYQFPEITCARITLDNQEFKSPNFKESTWKQEAKIYLHGQCKGSIEVLYLEEKPQEYDGPFLQEELSLINSIAGNITISIQRKLAEESLQKSEANIRTIFNHTNESYILLDRNFHILSFNTIANEWALLAFGCYLQEGDHITELITSELKPVSKEMFGSVLDGNIIEQEISYAMQDSSLRWFYVRLYPVRNEKQEVIGICIATKDITNRKKYELEREKMTAEIIQRNKDLEQFAYIVSHNLRAPVANIIGFADAMQTMNLTPAEQNDILAGLAESAKKLDGVIIDLNNILKLKRDISEKKEEVSFSNIIDDIELSIRNLILEQQVKIRCDFTETESMFTLKSYLYSIFFNLISNSIKYRQPGQPPVIEIKSRKTDQGFELRFRDNGLGIDLTRKNDQVFGLYKRFHPQIAEGKGLGLFMVKVQVETLGGKIKIASEVNKGTEFTIQFAS